MLNESALASEHAENEEVAIGRAFAAQPLDAKAEVKIEAHRVLVAGRNEASDAAQAALDERVGEGFAQQRAADPAPAAVAGDVHVAVELGEGVVADDRQDLASLHCCDRLRVGREIHAAYHLLRPLKERRPLLADDFDGGGHGEAPKQKARAARTGRAWGGLVRKYRKCSAGVTRALPGGGHVVAQDRVDVFERGDVRLVGPACHQQRLFAVFNGAR